MNTARRHDLRENELARQLGSLPDTLRRHAVTIGLSVGLVVVVAVSAAVYSSNRAASLNQAWETLNSGPQDAKTPEDRIAAYLELADKNITPTLSAMAVKNAADQALGSMITARLRGDVAGSQKYSDEARKLYERLGKEHDELLVTAAASRLGLAYLAEERGDYATAETAYKAMESDKRFAHTPFVEQAKFRLENLSKWKTPIVFAPASRPASAPASGPGASVMPAVVGPMAMPPMPAATQPGAMQP